MSKTTEIQWCDSTVNPIMGCSGCELWNKERKTCYAGQLHNLRKNHKGFSPDFLTPKLFPGRLAEAAAWPDLAGTNRPEKPWLDGLPRLIFVSDMGDALSEKDAIDNDNQPIEGGVPFEYLKSEIVDAARSPSGLRHRWLWLTKRPARLAQFDGWLRKQHGIDLPTNIWVGTSVTTKKTLGRIAQLAEVGHADTIRFLSIEPLWEEVSLATRLNGIGWVIVGGESRQGSVASEFHCDWARKLREECVAVGVPFFLKQLGSNVMEQGGSIKLKDSHGGDWNEWPSDLRVRQMPQEKLIDKIPSFDTSSTAVPKTSQSEKSQHQKGRCEMKMEIPNEDWSLEELAEFLKSTLRRSASDAWKIGKALSIARDRHKAQNEWIQWTKENVGISTATIYRYLDVFDRLTLEECEKKTLKEVYAIIESERKIERKESLPASDEPAPNDGEEPVSDSGEQHEPEAGGHPGEHPETGGEREEGSVANPSWAVNDEGEDHRTEFDEAVDDLTSAAIAWNTEGDLHFLNPDEKRTLLIAIEKLEKALAQAKAALAIQEPEISKKRKQYQVTRVPAFV